MITKRTVFHVLYLVVAIVTIGIPYKVHQKGGSCADGGLSHIGIFHLDLYRLKSILEANQNTATETSWRPTARNPSELTETEVILKEGPLTHGEVWELFALIQACLVSFLLMAEADDSSRPKYIIIVACVIFLLCWFAFNFLREDKFLEYELCLIGILIGFTSCDYLFYKRGIQKGSDDAAVFKFLLFYVDVPIFLAIVLLCTHVGFPIRPELAPFFSGAVAFQLMFGNLAIFLIRSHHGIDKSENLWEATKGVLLGRTPMQDIASVEVTTQT